MAARSWNENRLLNLLLTSKVFFLELAWKLCLQSLRPLGICRKKSSAMSFCPPSPLPLNSVSSRTPCSIECVTSRSSLRVLRPSSFSSPCPPRSWTSIVGGSRCKVFACCHIRFWAGASWARSHLLPPRLKCAPAGATTQTKFDSEQHELSSMTAGMHMLKAHVLCFKPPRALSASAPRFSLLAPGRSPISTLNGDEQRGSPLQIRIQTRMPSERLAAAHWAQVQVGLVNKAHC